MIHCDIQGPPHVPNVIGARWFLSFIDDHTCTTWVFLMKDKYEIAYIDKNFQSMIENMFHTKIQIFKTYNARDFFNSVLGNFFLEKGIVHQSSCVYTPEQNGIAERKNRHLLEIG